MTRFIYFLEIVHSILILSLDSQLCGDCVANLRAKHANSAYDWRLSRLWCCLVSNQ